MKSIRDLPSVDQVLRQIEPNGLPHAVVVEEIRTTIAEIRQKILSGDQTGDAEVLESVHHRLAALGTPSLGPVINGTGVVLHTNLGRAPLPRFDPITTYSNLEYDVGAGRRGKRDSHVSLLLERILGVGGIVVNNNAAAVFLVLNELAAGGEVIVSRGELIEIGDGFRIPEIMARSGAILREVGTTNRTRVEDIESAITERTRLILRVHPSNFRITGFTSRPSLEKLTRIARKHSIPLYEDLGSGCLTDLKTHGVDEPLVRDSLAAGVDVVSFSCDKLLGGPQAGIIAGEGALVKRIRRNPLYRAFRVDKLTLQVLQVTLRHLLHRNWTAIPALQMILQTVEEIKMRAERVHLQVAGALSCRIRESEAPIGGGSTPDQTLPSYALEIDTADAVVFERGLRAANPPVVARIEHGRVVIDFRTIFDHQEASLVSALHGAALTSGDTRPSRRQ
jgi:L-seryl-tRNA(Ser) seleniumtransferase